ncbi:MAG: MFS transporter [Bacteroidetes bacterium]|nr:MFS transporter [Bacteroidota bacterium]
MNSPNQATSSEHNTKKKIHPIVFTFLILPMGVMSGYVNVTLAFLYSSAGLSVEQVAALVAAGLAPHIFKFLWAPLVDSTLSAKKWYLIANTLSALGMLAMGILPVTSSNLVLISAIVWLANFAVTFVAMATESIMAYDVPEELKGRAGGYFQAGNLGGNGVGGGIGLLLAQRLPDPWMTAVIIAGSCFLCSAGLFFVNDVKSSVRGESLISSFRNVIVDIWNILKSQSGLLVVILCFLPMGTGAASNLWAAVADDWNASADTVALVTGVMGGLLSAAGCLLGGWICDRMNRKTAYWLFGLVGGLTALGMAFAPKTELMYILWTSFYAITVGLSYAGFTAVVLEAIGTGAAATKYNIFAALSNTPIYYMIYINGQAHTQWGPKGMLSTEAVFAFLAVLFFILLQLIITSKKNSSTKA